MAFVHGKGTAVSIDGDDLSVYSTSVTFTRTAEAHETTTFGKNSKTYAPGLKDATASLEGIYDNTANTGPGAVLRALIGAAAVEFVYQPEGDGVGKPVATVDALVTSYEESAPVADMITFTAELQLSDDIADTVGA